MSILKDTIIEKLSTQNYDVWKFKVEMYLEKENLYDVIRNDPPAPLTEEWNNKNRKARAIINLLIEDDQIIHVKNLETAREVWNALRAIHERSNLSSKLFLLRKLYSIKLAEGGDMNEHITRIYQTRDRLIAIGEQIDEHHLSALMLCSLPSSYDTLITALEARNEDELTPTFIRSKLIDEFTKRQEGNGDSFHNSAFKVKHSKPKMNVNKFCKYCKKASHNIDECWSLKNKNKKAPHQNNSNKSAISYREPKNMDRPHATENKNYTFIVGEITNEIWVLDSGSSVHVCNNINKFHKFIDEKSHITIANGQELESLGYGSVKLLTAMSDGSNNTITLKNVLYVPEIESNLISIKKATENGCIATFKDDACVISYQGETCLEGYVNNNLYACKIKKPQTNIANMVNTCKNENCISKWHSRLGHRNINHIKDLVNKDLAAGIKIHDCKHDNICEICIECKLTDNPYPKSATFRATKVLELVHSDLCGPMQTQTVGGKYYFLTFVDDYSRFTVIYLLRYKHEVSSRVREYLAMVTNKFGRKIQNIRSDNGGEYTGHELQEYLKSEGINHEFTVPYSAQQNGVAERKNRTLVEMARCLLKESNLPNSFWGEAVNTANYLQNRLPTSPCDTTPYEKWTGRKPDLSNIKTFGCRAYAYVQKIHRKKLDSTAKQGIFVGYDHRSKGYRICTDGKNIIISRTVKFLEDKNQTIMENSEINKEKSNQSNSQLQLQLSDTYSNDTGNDVQNLTGNLNISDNRQNLPRRSDRSNRGVPPDRFTYIIKTDDRIIEPKCWSDVNQIENPTEKESWIKATKEEIDSLNDNGTWDLVEAPPNKKVIGCKWAFKAKYDNLGKIIKYKARLVARGFAQRFGIDYEETFAPVVSHTTIRAFFNMAVYKNLELRHIDIKNAFLHGDLEEEIYMKQPPGYVKEGEEHKVCKLKKSLYGLKQSARTWNIKITKSLNGLGFVQSEVDKCLYKRISDGNTTYIIVYVDDIIIAGNTDDSNEIIKNLKLEYKLTDLGLLSYYLGINIKRPEKGTLILDQEHKINELVGKFNLAEARPCETPMDPGYVKDQDDRQNLLPDNNGYRQAIGSLLYLATITRPDINAAVNILSRRCEHPRQKDWEAVKRVIKYLNTTKDLKFIICNKERPTLSVYTDSDFANDLTDRKSTSGMLFKLGKNALSWSTKKQNTVSISSAEAEYISAASAAQETIYLITLLAELDIPQSLPIIIFEDNQSAIHLANSDKHHSRTKHIDVRYHLIKHLSEIGKIRLNYIPSDQMTADIFTKPLGKQAFTTHRKDLGLSDNTSDSCFRRSVGITKHASPEIRT